MPNIPHLVASFYPKNFITLPYEQSAQNYLLSDGKNHYSKDGKRLASHFDMMDWNGKKRRFLQQNTRIWEKYKSAYR